MDLDLDLNLDLDENQEDNDFHDNELKLAGEQKRNNIIFNNEFYFE